MNTYALADLNTISDYSNIVVHPHPMSYTVWKDYRRMAQFHRAFPNTIIDVAQNGVSFMTWLRIASVAVVEASGSASAAVHLYNTSLVFMLPKQLLDIRKRHTVSMINESMANITDSLRPTLRQAVDSSLERTSEEMRAARHACIKTKFGHIDGYEEYCVALLIMEKKVKIDESDQLRVRHAYSQFGTNPGCMPHVS